MSLAQDEPKKPERATHSPWSIQIASVAGIPIRIHFTFVLVFVWIALVGRRQQDFGWGLFVLAFFFCVLLHELGHALTAKRYGVQTQDITLYPIGGIAMLKGRPQPREELWIALAGPAVNMVIALLLVPVLLFADRGLPGFSLNLANKTFFQALFLGNLTLALFNMIPAFPMDGGRVLRSILALNVPEAKATRIAAGIGQMLAIVLGFAALFVPGTFGLSLMLVAFFVFLGAGQEATASVTRSFVSGRKASDAMQVRFRTIPNGATLDAAGKMLLEGSQQDFPVVNGDEIIGILTRADLARGLAAEGPSAYVAGHMRRDVRNVLPEAPLEEVMELLSEGNPTPVLVIDADERMVGMITAENLGEFIMIEHARSQSGSPGYAR